MATSVLSSRRALADKTTNVSLQSRGTDAETDMKAMVVMKSPILTQLRLATIAFEKGMSPRIGQKRSIAQVDGTEEHEEFIKQQTTRLDAAVRYYSGERATQRENADTAGDHNDENGNVYEGANMSELSAKRKATKFMTSDLDSSDPELSSAMEGVQTTELSSCFMESTETKSTPLTSFHASQEGSQVIEEQFSIQEEASQNTVEKLVNTHDGTMAVLPKAHTYAQNITPLPQNASQPQILSGSGQESGGPQDSTRLLSFVELDDEDDGAGGENEDEDEEDNSPQPITLQSTNPQPTAPPGGISRAAMIQETAQRLRASLGLAKFKVETDQIDTPFSQLRCRQDEPRLPPLPHLPYTRDAGERIWGARSVAGDKEEKVEEGEAEAEGEGAPRVGRSKSVPP